MDVEAPTGGLSSQASTEESGIENKNAPVTPPLPPIWVHHELQMLVNQIVMELGGIIVGFISHFRGTLNWTTLRFCLVFK